MSIIKEFKEFAVKGNLIDMAVAFVMGAAFTKVVTAFIQGMIMPIIGEITAGVDFKDMKHVLTPAEIDATGKEITPEVSIKYGEFLAQTIDFFLVALCLFFVVKTINRIKRKQEVVEAAKEPPREEVLLSEIRDILKHKNNV